VKLKHRLSDLDLLKAARTGDSSAFEAFYTRYSRLVMVYLRRRVTDSEQAADLLAEVFAAALLAVGSDAVLPDDPGAWLFGIARHKLIDSIRRTQVESRARATLGLERLEVDDDDLLQIDEMAHGESIVRLLDGLPASQREALRARILDERDYGEIGQQFGCSDFIVRKRVSRGLANLRSRLEQVE
jgi:RNA polymerase sigma-70 factor (ECF subfamily)